MIDTGWCNMKKIDKDIEKALIKKALGYTQEEMVEEYAKVDDDIVLSKRKITKKDVPPDMNAIKFLMTVKDISNKDIKNMSLKELESEREKYKQILENYEENDSE